MPRRPHYGPRRPKHNVPVNITETDEGFVAEVFCLGFAKENIRISLTGPHIYISGTRQPADDRPHFLLQEYPIRSFERWFELSERVDRHGVTARMRDGVLTIHAPFSPDARQPEITVAIE
jgi:HSP20 family protein